LKLDKNLKISHGFIETSELFGLKSSSDNLFYSFESPYLPYQQFLIGSFPRIDLVTMERESSKCLRGLEIKLTAIPDNSTHDLTEDKYSSELVIRPDSIVYLACNGSQDKLRKLMGGGFDAIKDWRDGNNILASVSKMAEVIDEISLELINKRH
jgi:hypothetical protein